MHEENGIVYSDNPGEINIDGKPYKIKDTWTININGDF